MENKIIPPKLTILIPTRNKAKNLDNTLRRLVIAVKNSVNLKTSDIEIIVSDNNSNDNTKKVSLTWLKNEKYIKYILQDKASSSAEESLLNSLKYANGEYIWFCCDDDFVKPDSINILYDSIKLAQSDLIIFGFKRFYLGNIFNNFETYSDIIQYDKGKDLFQDFGFISIPSLIPCLCIRNGSLNEEIFYQFIKTSKIYSHSFALMASFYNKKCSLINKELIIYNVPNQTKYFYNIGNAYKKELSYHAWTLGLVSLIEDLSDKINMPIKELATFNEVQPIME
jgi:glycosyltransferase involved in cell wall biosynthesis